MERMPMAEMAMVNRLATDQVHNVKGMAKQMAKGIEGGKMARSAGDRETKARAIDKADVAADNLAQ